MKSSHEGNPLPQHQVFNCCQTDNSCEFNTSQKNESSKEPANLSFLPSASQVFERSIGFMILPHAMLEYVLKNISKKVDLVVFLALLRQTLGHQRATCETSQSFLANFTGLDRSAVNRAVSSLVKQGHIERLGRGKSYDVRSVYRIPLVQSYLEYQDKTKRGKPQKTEECEESQVLLNQHQFRIKNDTRSSDESSPKKEEIINISKNNLLSLEQIPENLVSYFESIDAPQKRKDEWKRFLEIRKAVSDQQIASALEFLDQRGTLNKEERCHSPMRYLAVAISDVLSLVEKEQKETAKRGEAIRIEIAEKERKEKEDEQLLQEAKKRKEAFLVAFPDQESQAAFFEQFGRKMPGFTTSSPWLREMAILNWYQTKKNQA